MMREQENLRRRDAATPPPTYGRTLVVTAPDPHALLRNLIDAWSVIAGWGRWSDDDLGDWPPAAEMVAQLPEPLRARWQERPAEEVESWLDDLNERGWVWWSSTVDDGFVKIDLDADSLPASLWSLSRIIEMLGGSVRHQGDWLDLAAARQRAHAS
jgi:hypothetical protein